MSETVALEKKKQSRFSKRIRNVKKLVTSGKLPLAEGEAGKRPKRGRGVVYVGHIPHGFFEEEMRGYFSQFGRVTNLAICRSHRTGKSKGFAFVEFEHDDVAKIAAETVNNYIMFNRRLVANYIPFEKRSPRLFKGRVTTEESYVLKERRDKENRLKNKNPSRQVYLRQTKKTLANIRATMKKLREFGVDYAFEPVDVPVEIADSDVLREIAKVKARRKGKRAAGVAKSDGPALKTTPKIEEGSEESESEATPAKMKRRRTRAGKLKAKDKLKAPQKVSKGKLKLAAQMVLGKGSKKAASGIQKALKKK